MLAIMDRSCGNVLGLRLDGTLTGVDYAGVAPTIERLIDEYPKVRILVRVDRMPAVEPGAIWEDLKMGRHFLHFGRMAAVTDLDWIRRYVGMVGAVVPMPVRRFPVAEEDAAWDWIKQQERGTGHDNRS